MKADENQHIMSVLCMMHLGSIPITDETCIRE
jgi:hypothetical protein